MIKLIKGISYTTSTDRKIYKGQKVRFNSHMEEQLVSTGQFEYVGAKRVIYIKPTITNTLCVQGKEYNIIEDEPMDILADPGYEIIRLGFAKEVAVRTVIIESYEKLEETLFIRDGGFGDIVLLYEAFNYLFQQRPKLKQIHVMTDKRYMCLFENDKRFIVHSLDDYGVEAGRFRFILDLRMTVEGDNDTGDRDRLLLFIRFLGLSIVNLNPVNLQDVSIISIPKLKTKHDNLIKENTLVFNISTSRPERDLSKKAVLEVIDELLKIKSISNVIIINTNKFEYKDNPTKVHNLSASTTITEMIQIINKSKYYIGLDTGPSHLAGALLKKGLMIGGAIDLNLRALQYKNLKILQNNDMVCVKTNTCYSCKLVPNKSMPGKCMQFTGKQIVEKFREVL